MIKCLLLRPGLIAGPLHSKLILNQFQGLTGRGGEPRVGEPDPGDAGRRGEEILTLVKSLHSIYNLHSFDNIFIFNKCRVII